MVDYSLYLVTDSTMVPESSSFLKQIEDSVNAGATIVQLREKSLSTLEFIERAEKVHEITKKKGIPLIINDRIDVALAIDAEGVHVGQDDMPAKLARKLLGPDKILGVTCSNPEEVQVVVDEDVADYVGIGTVYATQTKKDTKTPLGTGPIGIRKMLHVLRKRNQIPDKPPIKCVAIGGINETNATKVLFQCQIKDQKLDGLAVVSCIMAKPDAYQATIDLQQQIDGSVPWLKDFQPVTKSYKYSDDIKLQVEKLRKAGALVHHITNNVVKNFSANVTLSIGASPIMSELAEEYDEFASKLDNISLVLNLGTPTSSMMDVFIHAVQVYNKYGKHIVFDPVAAGATNARLQCCRKLLNAGQMSVIKGNVGEILAIWKLTSDYNNVDSDKSLMRGVDSIASLSESEIIDMGLLVSKDFKCIVVISGAMNYIIDGTSDKIDNVEKVIGGSKLMGEITGSGCSLGSTIASFIASKADTNATKSDDVNIFEAVVGAVSLYNKSGKEAGDVTNYPGSFIPAFLDRLAINTSLV